MNPHPSIKEQRERLVLECQLDRLNFRLAMRPTPMEQVSLSLLGKLVSIAPRLPGKPGKWARAIMQGTVLFKGVYDAIYTNAA